MSEEKHDICVEEIITYRITIEADSKEEALRIAIDDLAENGNEAWECIKIFQGDPPYLESDCWCCNKSDD